MKTQPSPTRMAKTMVLEASVIVISILLAFGLDALWDANKREREAQIALTSLESEFQANLSSCRRVIRSLADSASDFADLMRTPDSELQGLCDEAATAAYNSFCSPRSFDALLGTTKSVISTGTFSILQDANLRNQLDVFLNLMDDTHEDIQNMLHYMRVLGEYEVSIGGPWGAPSDGDAEHADTSYMRMITAHQLLSLRDDPGFIGRVKLYHGCAAWYHGELTGLAAHIESVLDTIASLKG